MTNNDFDIISLKMLLGNDIYELYKEKCEAFKYQIRLFSRALINPNDFIFPNLDEIINKYWLKIFRVKKYDIKYDIKFDKYARFNPDTGSVKQFFLLGMIDVKKLNMIENDKIFILYEKRFNNMKFLNQNEKIIFLKEESL